MIAFGIVVGIAILICYRLLTRVPNRRLINGPFADRSGPAGGNDAGDSGSHFAWGAGENSASDHSSVASDSGGGGDSGGGDGGGGGSD
jgi:hypothetical protein